MRDPFLVAVISCVALLATLAVRVRSWLTHMPRSHGWRFAVRHELYPHDLFLYFVLLLILLPVCVVIAVVRVVRFIRQQDRPRVIQWPWQKDRVVARIKANLCPACGYDIRSSDGTCPECGSHIRNLPRPIRVTPPRPKANTADRRWLRLS